MPMNTLIVGGGIGGLTAAIALARIGHRVTVAEKMPAFEPVGAGIIMAPNATRVLAELNIDLSRHGYALPSFDVVRADGSLLQRMETQRLAGRYGPMWALSRPALHRALLDAMPAGVRLFRGRAVSGILDTGNAVEVRFDDEQPSHSFDIVIGADGLHSTVRDLLLGPQRLRYSGVTCWRGLIRNPGYTRAIEAWGGDTRIGVVPLPAQQLYYYLVKSAPRRAPALDWPTGFHRAFDRHKGGLNQLFDVLTDPPPLHHDLEELDHPVWGRNRVFLLGDAAHAMTPNQGQGAAMAIEDAYALMLALTPGVPAAVERYTELRHRRVRKIQLTSRRIGALSHWTNPLARSARDSLMRSLPTSMAESQYRQLVQPALDLLHAA